MDWLETFFIASIVILVVCLLALYSDKVGKHPWEDSDE